MIRYLTCAKPFGTNAWLEAPPVGVRFSPPVNGPKDPWPRVLSLSEARVVCWRPHLAGTRQYILRFHTSAYVRHVLVVYFSDQIVQFVFPLQSLIMGWEQNFMIVWRIGVKNMAYCSLLAGSKY